MAPLTWLSTCDAFLSARLSRFSRATTACAIFESEALSAFSASFLRSRRSTWSWTTPSLALIALIALLTKSLISSRVPESSRPPAVCIMSLNCVTTFSTTKSTSLPSVCERTSVSVLMYSYETVSKESSDVSSWLPISAARRRLGSRWTASKSEKSRR